MELTIATRLRHNGLYNVGAVVYRVTLNATVVGSISNRLALFLFPLAIE